jgi:hypothetical protein
MASPYAGTYPFKRVYTRKRQVARPRDGELDSKARASAVPYAKPEAK